MRRRSKAALVVGVVSWLGCEERPEVVRLATSDAGHHEDVARPQARGGCERVGSVAAALRDPSCAVAHVGEGAMRAAMRQLAIDASVDPPEVLPGGTAVVTVTLRNASSSEATVFLEARQRLPGPRTDWSRVAGVPAPSEARSAAPRLFFPMTTLDAKGRDVDALPTIPKSAEPTPSPPKALAVHVRPGGKLTHVMSWWAYRIPAPLPIVKDDAGRHRYVPKTSAVNLVPGQYTIVVDVPLFGLGKEERKLETTVHVVRAARIDGDGGS